MLGNVSAIVNPEGTPKVMLAAHCDEIGFLVTHVTSEGYIYFGSIGGHDATVTVGQRVFVHTADGPLLGVIGKKPVHVLEGNERNRPPSLHDLFVDIGAQGKTVGERVSDGDPITYAPGFATLEGDLVVSHAFDDKAGVVAVAETLRLLAGRPLAAAVYGVSTVQEEIGLRGAHTSAFGIAPQVGIAIDVTFATDFPGMTKTRHGDIALGKGPVIARGANINPQVCKMLHEVAKDLEIPCQTKSQGGKTGTDAAAMQTSRGGMATGLVSIPLRYMHTPCEVVSLSDLENTARLLAGFIERVTPATDWTPSLENLHLRIPPRPKAGDKEQTP